ncbi:SGNH/GDSL hydrolase family protein [Enterococcus nangangensis]|uniref:SGNH/GDSL hydrolase family protein n=1 Tax=Enterococcus nangangensis TaxID=2559926 RepID=UPI0010F91EA4|nr:SGNH/GDSL hydrolase family protein [Enterococcus nangangensis]
MIKDNIDFHNVEEFVYNPKTHGYKLSRVPGNIREKLNEKAQGMAYNTCGVELRFFMESEEVKLKFSRHIGGDNILNHGIVTVYQGDIQTSYELSNQIISLSESEITLKKKYLFKNGLQKISQSFNPELIRVILPYDWAHEYLGVEGLVRLPSKADYPPDSFIAYGSSITHGGSATLSSNSYVFKLSQKLKKDYYNLGFAGSCQLDKEIAEFLRDKNGIF